MGLVAGNVGVKTIFEVLRCLAFYCGGHGSGYVMGLVAGNVGVKAILEVFRCLPFYRSGHGSGYIMGLVAGNVGGKAILEVLRCLTFYCGGHGSIYNMGLSAGDVGFKAFIVFNLLAADYFGGVAGGFYFVGAVHALGEGDCSVVAFGFVHNAASEIFGDGEGVGTFSYSNLPFSCILSDGGVLILSVHCFVHCFVFHVEGVAIADHASGDVLLGVVW